MDFNLFDNILDAIFVLDGNKKIIYCNEASSILIGISQRRLQKGKLFKEVIIIEERSHFLMLDEVLSEVDLKESFDAYKELNFQTQSGQLGSALIMMQKIQNKDAKDCIIVFLREMTLEENLHSKYKEELKQKEGVIEELKSAQIELKNYSQNLEKMVEKRTLELKETNHFINAMINSLEQGLLVFNREGDCLPIYTKACEEIYEKVPLGEKIWNLINQNDEKKGEVEFWAKGIFKSMIPFIDFIKLGPQSFNSQSGKYIELEYFPLKDDNNNLEGIVTVATDKSEELMAKNAAIKEYKYSQMILKISRNKDHFIQFIQDCRFLINDLSDKFEKGKVHSWDVDEIFRDVHSIKGGALMFSILRIEEASHKLENSLSILRKKSLEEIVMQIPQLTEELSKLKVVFEQTIDECRIVVGDSLETGERSVEILVQDLKDYSQKIGMCNEFDENLKKEFESRFLNRSIECFFNNYDSMIKEIASKNGKMMNDLVFENGDIRVNPDIYFDLFNVLVHLYRNAVYHGIETVDERKALNKKQKGTIKTKFNVFHLKNGEKNLEIDIEDDGSGIDIDSLKKKLKNKDPDNTKIDQETDDEIVMHIFDMGVSTSQGVNKVAGRGVGMDAVKVEVEKLGGNIKVKTKKGSGTKMLIVIPFCEQSIIRKCG